MPYNRVLVGIGGVCFFLGVWELAVSIAGGHYQYLPAPSAILLAFPKLLQERPVISECLHTVWATLLGWIIAVTLGLLLGIPLGLSRLARRYSLATVEFLRPLPGIAFVPPALILFGFSTEMELAVIVLPAMWPVLINTIGGLMNIPQRLHDVKSAFRLSKTAGALKIFLPAAAHSFLVGCRLSLTTSLVLAVIAEMIGNPDGLGYAIVREQQALQPTFMFGYILLIGFLGVVMNSLILRLSKLLLPGQFRARSHQAAN